MPTHYDTLGIAQDAGKEEIRKAYKKLASQHHPDRNPGNERAVDRFKEVTAAYEVLNDDRKKAVYDMNLSFGAGPFPLPGNPFSARNPFSANVGIVDEFMQEVIRQGLDPSVFRRRGRSGVRGGPVPSAPSPRRTRQREVREPERDGKDIETELPITLDEAAVGCLKEVSSRTRTKLPCFTCSGTGRRPGTRAAPCSACGGRRQRPNFDLNGPLHDVMCPACDGKGHVPLSPCQECDGVGKRKALREVKVRIPVGVDEGQRLRLAGQGEPGVGRPPGDLFVTVRMVPHETFLRKGQDVYVEHAVSLDVALKGGTADVPTLGGPPLSVEVPVGMEPGRTVVTVRGAGIPSALRNDRGDLYVTLQVSLPKVRTPRADRLLQELLEELRKGVR